MKPLQHVHYTRTRTWKVLEYVGSETATTVFPTIFMMMCHQPHGTGGQLLPWAGKEAVDSEMLWNGAIIETAPFGAVYFENNLEFLEVPECSIDRS